MLRRFQQVDVFAATPYAGNPVAVVLDAEGLSTDDMARIGRWTNLSETTFVLPATTPDADYRVRIFNRPKREDLVIQECLAGLVPVRRMGGTLSFAAPPLVHGGPVDEAYVERIATVLQIKRDAIADAQWVDNGPGWVAVLLDSADAVLAVIPASAVDGKWDIGVVGAYPPGAECALEVRAFFTDERGRLIEDPVTGSLNASLAQWLLATGRATARYIASQGTRLGRLGRVHIDQDTDGTIWVGGATTTCIDGQIDI